MKTRTIILFVIACLVFVCGLVASGFCIAAIFKDPYSCYAQLSILCALFWISGRIANILELSKSFFNKDSYFAAACKSLVLGSWSYPLIFLTTTCDAGMGIYACFAIGILQISLHQEAIK